MPEYLYPGVYLEEIEAHPLPIPGVSTSLDGAALTAIAADFRRTMGAYAPAWTDLNDSDPGVTLVEVFAFLSENLHRAGEA
jgi:phage tail sheath protein FI